MQYKYYRHNQGFTLVELITVIVILGILTTVGASKFFKQSSFEDTQYHQEVLSAFRFAQKIAIASQCNVDVKLKLDDYRYLLSYSGDCSGNGNVKHPAGQGDFRDTDDSAFAATLTYTATSTGEVTPTGTILAGGHNITIEPVTGYVHD